MNNQNSSNEELCSEILSQKEKINLLEQKITEWKATFDAIDDFVLRINTELEIIDINKSCLQNFGQVRENAIGKKCYEIIHNSNSPIKECVCLEAMQKKATVINKYKHENKTFEITAWPVYNDSKSITSLTHIIKDITEKEESDLQIKLQNLELQKLNSTKNKLFSIIAHDLRSPIITVYGYAELLKDIIDTTDTSDTSDTAKTEKYIDIIYTETKYNVELIDNLLNWAISQNEDLVTSPEPINIKELLEKKIKTFSLAANQKKIKINMNLQTQILVLADSTMLEIILRNLISNALKFTGENGEVIIQVSKNKDHVEISIADNGIGIPKENIEKIFSPDEKISTKGTANEKGTGLGLIITKEFVEKNGGKIWVESNPGTGSNFKFTLPLCKN